MTEDELFDGIMAAIGTEGDELEKALDRMRATAANFAPGASLLLAADMLDQYAGYDEQPTCVATELAKILRMIEPQLSLVRSGPTN